MIKWLSLFHCEFNSLFWVTRKQIIINCYEVHYFKNLWLTICYYFHSGPKTIMLAELDEFTSGIFSHWTVCNHLCLCQIDGCGKFCIFFYIFSSSDQDELWQPIMKSAKIIQILFFLIFEMRWDEIIWIHACNKRKRKRRKENSYKSNMLN